MAIQSNFGNQNVFSYSDDFSSSTKFNAEWTYATVS